MITLYLITGPAGIGKSTVSEEIANRLEKSVHIEGDVIYNFVKGGYVSPWKEGNQLKLLWQNLVTLSYNYFLNEYNVVLDYIITMENIEAFVRFSEEFKSFKIKFVVLMADEEILVKRDKMRSEDVQMGNRVLELLREFQEQNFDENHILDTSNMTIDEVVKEILENDKYIVNEETFFNENYFEKLNQNKDKNKIENKNDNIKNTESLDSKTLNIMRKAHVVKYKSNMYMLAKISKDEYKSISNAITTKNKHVLKFHDDKSKTIKEIIGNFEDFSDDKKLLEEIFDENIWLQKIGYDIDDENLKLFLIKTSMNEELERFTKEEDKREKTTLEKFYELTEIPDPNQKAFERTLEKADKLIMEMTDVEFIELMKTPLNPNFKARFMEVRNRGSKEKDKG